MSATLTTLASFSGGANGEEPDGSLGADANGSLFGTTEADGADGDGTVFEIVKTASGYASTPTTLASFDETNGAGPPAGLIVDANGDLIGTTASGVNNAGAVFEIAKTPTGYASTPTTLVSFSFTGDDGAGPNGSLIAGANGDLFGTTSGGGANGFGTVFEIAKTPTGYASTPTTLVSFDLPGSGEPLAGLIADANGDLFGTTLQGGLNDGTVFEIAKTPTGYASTPTVLASIDIFGSAGLVADSNGDLFGTTRGTVFELVKTPTGYHSTPITVAGIGSDASLIVDAKGDLFGTTETVGASGQGSVFEIAKTAAGYADPTTVASFDGDDGRFPVAGLMTDINGDLFGSTPSGGPNFPVNNSGTVFEITDSGFATTGSVTPTVSRDILWENTDGQAAVWDMNGNNVIGGGKVSLASLEPSTWFAIGTGDFNDDSLPDILWQNYGGFEDGGVAISDMNGTLIGGEGVSANPGPNWFAIGTGDFNDDHHSDILWQNASTGQASIWEMNANNVIGGGAVSPNPGPSWFAVGTGDFNKDGDSDILWQNANTGQVSIWEMSGNKIIGGGKVSPNPGPSWQAIGTGDFNHDGFSDILFQNTSTGQVSVWEMSGNTLIGGGSVANPGTSWFAVGTGGGGSDILLQNASGQASIWDMNGNKIIGGGPVSPNPGPSWFAVGLT
jgi:uncharacterized repeat protein (TIGR03803 family)